MKNSRCLLSLVALAVALMVGGCAGPDDEQTESEILVQSLVAMRAGYTEPLEFRLEEEHVRDCMKLDGFDYEMNEYVASPADVETAAFWIEPDLEFAREHGFGIVDDFLRGTSLDSDVPVPDEAETGTTEDDSNVIEQATGRAYEEALNGDLSNGGELGGCRLKAQRLVDEELRDAELPSDATMLALAMALERSPRLLQIQDEWSVCMAEHGYEFQAEEDAINEVVQMAKQLDESVVNESEIASIQEFEIDIAVADVECISPHFDELTLEYEQLAKEAIQETGW